MRPYVTMYPNYYPYDNNNNNHDKKAWSGGGGGGGGGGGVGAKTEYETRTSLGNSLERL